MATWTIILLLMYVIASEGSCPITCMCTLGTVSCRDSELSAIPEKVDPQIQILDLSYNNFLTIPTNISKFSILEILVLKHNKIDALDINALRGLKYLKELDLSHNIIAKWADISPYFLKPTSVAVLDLSHNPLKGFPKLTSISLTALTLVNCSITSMRSEGLYTLPKLTQLDLSDNRFNVLTVPFKGGGLKLLNLTNCGIEEIHVNAFAELSNLQTLVLARNANLKNFHAYTTAKKLDLSDCNLESIPRSALANLVSLNLHGNHLRRIEELSFREMFNLKLLWLTNNAIEHISADAFVGLRNISAIDLSFNVINELSPNLILMNPNLKQLLLSHNYLTELVPFVSKSLEVLDMSECEINSIDRDSLVNMPQLVHLNLSRNVFTSIPNNFTSSRVHTLDLGLCRITNLKNESFAKMPNLRSLNLAGNRLVEIKYHYLHSVSLVRLSDNTWRCDCNSASFKELFLWLTKFNSDAYQLTCQSPEHLEGKYWYQACGMGWFSETDGRNERAWLFLFVIILAMLSVFLVIIYTNRARKKKRERELQRVRDQTEAMERLRRLRMREEPNLERNAPDPREAERPPSYNEAIAMPPLGSTENNSRAKTVRDNNNTTKKAKTRRKRRRSRTAASTSRAHPEEGASTPAEVMESDF